MPKKHSCKIGTMPGLVILKGNSKPTVGRSITFRRAEPRSKWQTGKVDRINPDGYFFIDLI